MRVMITMALCTLLSISVLASSRKLSKAIEAGDLAKVQEELQDGTSPNKDYKDRLPLIHAIELGHREIVDALLSANVDVNKAQEDGKTALMSAIRFLDDELVKKLVEKGADVNMSTAKGFPLFHAVAMSDKDLIDYLIEKGANVKQLNSDKESLLFPAARSGSLGITRHLIQLGLDVNHADEDGETPFLAASYSKDVAMLKLLLFKGADRHARDNHNRNAMTWAAIFGNDAQVALLTALGLDIELKDKDNANPIGYIQFFQATAKLEAVQDPMAVMGDGFHQAVMLNDMAALETLLKDENFSFDSIECPGICLIGTDNYPMLFAIRYGNLELIQKLFNHGAPINRKFEKASSTPLREAATLGRTDLVRYLMAKGVALEESDAHMTSALNMAITNDKQWIAKTLWDAGARIYKYSHTGEPLRYQDGEFNFERLKAENETLEKKHKPSIDGDEDPCVPVGDVYNLAKCDSVTHPKFTKRIAPVYPKLAIERGIGYATVVLESILDKNGTIRDIRVLKGSGYPRMGFEYAAIQSLKKWEYLPASVDGKAATVRMTLKIDFEMKRQY